MLPNRNQSPNVVKLLQIYLFWNLVIFLEKKNITTECSLFIFIFRISPKFSGGKKNIEGAWIMLSNEHQMMIQFLEHNITIHIHFSGMRN